MDGAWQGLRDAQCLLMLSSGCRGVEGCCGSGAQVALLRDAAWRDRVDRACARGRAAGHGSLSLSGPHRRQAGLLEGNLARRTLTNLYNQRPARLTQAHEALDAAVAAAYGWADYTPAMPDDEILRRLLALNLVRAKA